jgi:hypothetical protein
MFLEKHGDQQPFRAERDESRGEKTQEKEGRVAVRGEEIVHGVKVTERMSFVKGFAGRRFRLGR